MYLFGAKRNIVLGGKKNAVSLCPKLKLFYITLILATKSSLRLNGVSEFVLLEKNLLYL